MLHVHTPLLSLSKPFWLLQTLTSLTKALKISCNILVFFFVFLYHPPYWWHLYSNIELSQPTVLAELVASGGLGAPGTPEISYDKFLNLLVVSPESTKEKSSETAFF